MTEKMNKAVLQLLTIYRYILCRTRGDRKLQKRNLSREVLKVKIEK